jgi:hypothetical protein
MKETSITKATLVVNLITMLVVLVGVFGPKVLTKTSTQGQQQQSAASSQLHTPTASKWPQQTSTNAVGVVGGAVQAGGAVSLVQKPAVLLHHSNLLQAPVATLRQTNSLVGYRPYLPPNTANSSPSSQK